MNTPSFCEFVPLPYQYDVIEDVEENFDYNLGSHEILLSGSVGSAKSILLAHLAIKHCLKFPRARLLIGRKALQDLRLTIWRKILEHLEGSLIRDKHYKVNLAQMTITFMNGSQIISRSWADGQYMKLRSLELSAAVIEELTENDEEDKQAYEEIKMRVGRLPSIKENIIISASNPDAPSHWAYKHFIDCQPHSTRHVYYSVTTDNPYLPPQYIDQLKRDLDPKMAERMIYGRWIEISGEVIYYQYDKEVNFKNEDYELNEKEPIHITFDFNIGEGKPMSCAVLQYLWPTCHVFDESVIHSARTEEVIEDLNARGLLIRGRKYIISGDAAGKHRDTRSKRSDYDIICEGLRRYGIDFEMRVPPANPPIRTRHNVVNARIKNSLNEVNLYVYKKAKTVDEGFRLTKLKKGAHYLEDDSRHFQHVTTAVGYDIIMETRMRESTGNRTREL